MSSAFLILLRFQDLRAVRLELGFVLTAICVIWLLDLGVLATVGRKTTLHDHVAHTRVVVDLEAT